MSRVKPPAPGRRQSVRTVEVGISVLSALGRLGGSATLSELSAFVHLPASKAHRYLRALSSSGFVEQDAATGDYRLGVESLTLGLTALAQINLVSVATPFMAMLSKRVNETAILSIWANGGATVVHVKEPPRRVTVVTRIGSVLPLLSSASGLAFAAHLPAAESKLHIRSAAKHAGSDLQKRLREVRANGIARVQSLFFPGIDALAAPIFDAAGRIAAVLTVLGPTSSFDASIDGSIARRVIATAASVSTRIGYRDFRSSARTRSKSLSVSTPATGASASSSK